MKKLMIAAAIVCAAALSQAATMKWQSSEIILHDGVTQADKDDVTANLYTLTKAQYDSWIEAYAKDGEGLSKAVYAAFNTETPIATKNSLGTGKALLTDPATYSSGNTAYAAILYFDNNDTEYYMGNIGTYKFDSDDNMTINEMALTIGGDDISGTGSTAWVAASVPEPTSGLLLLLGVAGLALRRRRA